MNVYTFDDNMLLINQQFLERKALKDIYSFYGAFCIVNFFLSIIYWEYGEMNSNSYDDVSLLPGFFSIKFSITHLKKSV